MSSSQTDHVQHLPELKTFQYFFDEGFFFLNTSHLMFPWQQNHGESLDCILFKILMPGKINTSY